MWVPVYMTQVLVGLLDLYSFGLYPVQWSHTYSLVIQTCVVFCDVNYSVSTSRLLFILTQYWSRMSFISLLCIQFKLSFKLFSIELNVQASGLDTLSRYHAIIAVATSMLSNHFFCSTFIEFP